jgi:autotransporter-associated beta strand protein
LTVNGGILDLNGTNQTVGTFSGTGGTILNNLTGTNTLTFGAAANASYSGVIADNNNAGSGILALFKNGSGTETLTGANTYSGATRQCRKLIVNGSLGATDVSVNSGAFAGAGNGTTTGIIGTSSGGSVR